MTKLGVAAAVEALKGNQEKLVRGHYPGVGPGQLVRVTRALSAQTKDCVAQGDVLFCIEDNPPEGYVKVERPTEKNLTVAFDIGTEGSHHRLRSLHGVEIWMPPNWTDESLDGPFLRFHKAGAIDHPRHGTLLIEEGVSGVCRYPLSYDVVKKQIAKQRD